ncbi:MAG: glycosyltransferase family 2 protein, partial [Merismopedia sp. SIO2A8]|nr:glycosyltransferase family 2 protein [Merismopedia sp. SIO2A8]
YSKPSYSKPGHSKPSHSKPSHSNQGHSNQGHSNQNRIIQRYLNQYAEPLVHQVPDITTTGDRFQHVLVIPAYDETVGCIERVLPSDIRHTLVIVVVNAAVDCDRSSIERTQQLLHSLTTTNDLFTLIAHTTGTTLLVVDCCTEGRQLPIKQGVGLARKIGGDIALAYIDQGAIATDWIHYTDADVVLPQDFFACVDTLQQTQQDEPSNTDPAVILYPFQHHPPHDHILLYELSLRYYVTQLAQARSPYAFHTIGSLMSINALHYAKVRGFPKRKAAEDFYMLNKLAKTGSVVRLLQPVVTLDSRCSHRVPFGTGAMMTRLANTKGEAHAFSASHTSVPPSSNYPSAPHPCLLYHPAIFAHLGDWLACIDELWSIEPCLSDKGTDGKAIAQWFAQRQWSDAIWIPCLLAMGLEKTIQQAHRQCRDLAHFRFFMWTWFDAFRTLKFVHYLRDHHYPPIDAEALSMELGLLDHRLQGLKSMNDYFQKQEQTLTLSVGPTLAFNQNHKSIQNSHF